MISLNEALDVILGDVGVLQSIEKELWASYGSVIEEDVRSDTDIPPFNRAAMDGYAVRCRDIVSVPVSLRVIGSIPAGERAEGPLVEGTCMKIMTGAPVPEDADAVVMVEDTESLSDELVRFKKPVSPAENVARVGEDVKKGDIVLGRGSRIRGPEIAVCASVGKTALRVVRTPSVGVLSTGNEIVEPSVMPQYGKIRNSNGVMLSSLVTGCGCGAEYMGIASDSEEGLRGVIHKGFEKDVFLLSGGVSMGEYDLVPHILQAEGARILFHRVRVKPGKPLLFAKKGACRIFGVPGNPVSNFTTFFLFVRPALLKMMGREDYRPYFIDAELTREFTYTSNRALVVPSRCTVLGGALKVTPFSLNGSADIAGCVGANCLALFAEGSKKIQSGERVKVLRIDDN
jgi:molybdopterin molybdotransferase